jgi:WD40 repeat protein
MHCPYCGKEHPDTALFCPDTGKNLLTQQKPACSFCNHEIPAQAIFCPYCSSRLIPVSVEPVSEAVLETPGAWAEPSGAKPPAEGPVDEGWTSKEFPPSTPEKVEPVTSDQPWSAHLQPESLSTTGRRARRTSLLFTFVILGLCLLGAGSVAAGYTLLPPDFIAQVKQLPLVAFPQDTPTGLPLQIQAGTSIPVTHGPTEAGGGSVPEEASPTPTVPTWTPTMSPTALPSPTQTPTPTPTPATALEEWTRVSLVRELILSGHAGNVRTLAYSQDGTVLASGSAGSTILVFDPKTGAKLNEAEAKIGEISQVALTAEGSRLAAASTDGKVRVWDIKNNRFLFELTGHTDEVRAVAFNPAASLLASAGRDGTIRIWDMQDGSLADQLYSPRTGIEKRIFALAFTPDGKILASGGADNLIWLWEVESGRRLKSLAGHSEDVWDIAISPDGALLASASSDETVILWDLATAQILHILYGHTDKVKSVSFSADGTLLASISSLDPPLLWNVEDGSAAGNIPVTGAISLAFSPDGSQVAICTKNGTVEIWHPGP